jgi:hypothetical protein
MWLAVAGVALRKPSRQVLCLDGDGALLMHMGTMASIGTSGAQNFKHIVINNGQLPLPLPLQPAVSFSHPSVVTVCVCAVGQVLTTQSVDSPRPVSKSISRLSPKRVATKRRWLLTPRPKSLRSVPLPLSPSLCSYLG